LPDVWALPRLILDILRDERMNVFGFDLTDLYPFIAIGFAAQLVDGALGMAFGVIANTALLWMGVPPAIATSYVHVIKSFTGGVSGISHILHKNETLLQAFGLRCRMRRAWCLSPFAAAS
jgi:hypothetical protein